MFAGLCMRISWRSGDAHADMRDRCTTGAWLREYRMHPVLP